jgi:succinylarginine dihydrolase
MALILPTEARDTPSVWTWLEQMIASNGPIRQLVPVDVRQSMANGGGPACLRLRVVADPADIDPRFLVDEAGLDGIATIVSQYWPESIAPQDLSDTRLIARIEQSWLTLVDHLQLSGDLFP